jgi:cell wall-associated NlpC family hydrolase
MIRADERTSSARGARARGVAKLLSSDERGTVTVVAVACLFLILTLCLFLTDLGMFLAAKHQAQNAADAAAIAAVQESFPLFGTGSDPDSAARRIALANGARLQSLEFARDGEMAVVEVTVSSPSLLLARLGLGSREAGAVAAAEVDIEALIASGDFWYTVDPSSLPDLRSLVKNLSPEQAGHLSTMVVLFALQHLGKPYVWGATGPGAFDCSGLVCYVFAQAGIRVPRSTFDQVRAGRPVILSELAPGDLVFFRSHNHVGVYIGGGYYIHAPRTGDVVKISVLSGRRDLSACRRIIR